MSLEDLAKKEVEGKNKLNELMQLQIGESTNWVEHGVKILRVPNGWIYGNRDHLGRFVGTVFVPQPTKRDKN